MQTNSSFVSGGEEEAERKFRQNPHLKKGHFSASQRYISPYCASRVRFAREIKRNLKQLNEYIWSRGYARPWLACFEILHISPV